MFKINLNTLVIINLKSKDQYKSTRKESRLQLQYSNEYDQTETWISRIPEENREN